MSDYRVKGILIELSDADLAKAKEVGDGRNAANVRSQDKPYYDRSRMESVSYTHLTLPTID
jgi:hypothetical protein